ncbi:MAG: hypothetical protein AB7S39_02480 [Gemmatimonadales bacterium]
MVKGGLDGLLSHWESLVAAVEDGYDLTFDDYLNDMDLRDILAGALEVAAADDRAAAERRIEKLDRRFHSLTVECGPIWGETAARENGHDSNDQWWYFRRPKRPAPDFEEELREAGLV